MGKRTSYAPGVFSWTDLGTTDVDGATAFYREIFGWEAEAVPVPDAPPYVLMRIDGDTVAAVYEQPEQQRSAGIPPFWFCYVTVASADESAARAKELGGNVHADPFDVMELGRMAVIADPTGAMFGVWEPFSNIGADRVNGPGCLSWNELATNDIEKAIAFYTSLFGWRIEEIDTGGGPRYWSIGHDGAAEGRNGGMRELGPAEKGVPPNWVPYFGAESVDGALARAEELGGATLAPAMEVPAGKFAAVRDPQGAVFSILEGEYDE